MYGTTRSAEYCDELKLIGITPILIESFSEPKSAALISSLVANSRVIVSFAPDLKSDSAASGLVASAEKIVYISSTAVYGSVEGIVDETTGTDENSPQARARLEAENLWRSVGANIVRAPGIYGFDSGIHMRLMNGQYKLPGDGSNYVSRVHVNDLANIVLNALAFPEKGQTFLAGDLKPATHLEVVEFLCDRLDLPLPDAIPIEECHYTLRGNRQVNAQKSLHRLGVDLQYPTFKEGYNAAIARFKAQ